LNKLILGQEHASTSHKLLNKPVELLTAAENKLKFYFAVSLSLAWLSNFRRGFCNPLGTFISKMGVYTKMVWESE